MLILPIMLLTFTTQNAAVVAQSVPQTTKVEARQLDPRAKTLADYFATKNSPFQYQAQDFIDAADKYNIDWKLVPAISGVESTFGTNSYGYNAWGWGIYGNSALGFNSWKDGIYTVTGGLKTGYIDKGLTDPYSINKIYAASPTWGSRVNFFMNDLEKYDATHQTPIITENNFSKIAGTSAQLALK